MIKMKKKTKLVSNENSPVRLSFVELKVGIGKDMLEAKIGWLFAED